MPAAAVTTNAKPHAQQQLARDLEVEQAVMGQRCRRQSSGPGLLYAAARFGLAVLNNNLSLPEGLDFIPAASATTKNTIKTFFTFRTEQYLGTRTAVRLLGASPPRGARSGGHDSSQAARTAATCTTTTDSPVDTRSPVFDTSSSFIVYPFPLAGTQLAEYE